MRTQTPTNKKVVFSLAPAKTHRPARLAALLLLLMGLGACANLLPSIQREVTTPWASFDQAKRSFDQIVPYETKLADVVSLGFGPDHLPNMKILNQAQVVQAALPSPLQDPATIPRGVVDCMRAGAACVGYAMEPSKIEDRRTGNVVLDLLNFRRDTLSTGWKFAALIVVVNDTVVYKQWSGQPSIRATTRRTNPLGPLQAAMEDLSLGVP